MKLVTASFLASTTLLDSLLTMPCNKMQGTGTSFVNASMCIQKSEDCVLDVHTYTHTYIHKINTYIRMYVCTHTHTHTRMRAQHTHIHTYIRTYTHTHIRTYTHTHTVHTYIYTHTYITQGQGMLCK